MQDFRSKKPVSCIFLFCVFYFYPASVCVFLFASFTEYFTNLCI